MHETLRFALQGFAVAFVAALVFVPICVLLARRLGIVDRPGGRKQHARVTPLLGGLGVFLACGVGLVVMNGQTARFPEIDLRLEQIRTVLLGGVVLFVIGLIDDIFKDKLGFVTKLAGQVVGICALMWNTLERLFTVGGSVPQWLYAFFLLLWFLTIVNSFNFSDNMNGLMSGLCVIAFSASVVYLGSQESLRSMLVAALLTGGLLGFLPYNFPRSHVFLGDAGSMFAGFFMAWVQFDMAKGVLDTSASTGGIDFGVHNLIPAVLIMGLPLYDAAFVVIMRIVDKRPVYLGDDQHLSHRLVRGGFTPVEAVVILWGLGIILAGTGILAAFSVPLYRYVLLGASVLFMVAVTRVFMAVEKAPR